MDGLFPDLYILIPGNTYDFQSSQMIFLVNIKKIHVFLTTKRIRGLPENNQFQFTFYGIQGKRISDLRGNGEIRYNIPFLKLFHISNKFRNEMSGDRCFCRISQ